ncbi:type II toxin-antitoxin system HipA family toxin (plasmid) [Trichlorobacter lovleyi]|uniref:type II toxin-antitoxin system HipA family toxin n=1 Tax=Trichlorobacter lovleyi TaxID=313985 RepID=UPI00223F9DBF|nr:type II toxin-antitoxin system HipA family toxin [Trichlorobacter lovleyi]QOX80894.1 type II toxin-antitoxin system HipA family toxin [Trichlorobacter lovleyi]
MSTVAEVKLWGKTIGAVVLEDGRDVALFEYDPAFVRSGIEVSPLEMPLSGGVYSFPALSRDSFHGLPGLLADSLPDKYGNALIDEWLALQGRLPGSMNAVERLCYTGSRGMGALEYLPATGPNRSKSATPVDIDRLVQLASEVLNRRGELQASFCNDDLTESALLDILRVGTSAGGARAKAIIAFNPETKEVRSGQVKAPIGFEYWLIKFDGVSGNKDKEKVSDPQGFGKIEYAYYLMAKDCHIDMSECELLHENGRSHFMTKRFDRLPNGSKLHMQSLAALAHYDFNVAGVNSYEQAMMVCRRIGAPVGSIEQMFRRMAFNIVARNQDDHVKNIAFLMDKKGSWALSPAFDMAYSYNPTGDWTDKHQMSMNGKRDGFAPDDFKECSRVAGLKQGQGLSILREVQSVVLNWPDYAGRAGIDEKTAESIAAAHRLSL